MCLKLMSIHFSSLPGESWISLDLIYLFNAFSHYYEVYIFFNGSLTFCSAFCVWKFKTVVYELKIKLIQIDHVLKSTHNELDKHINN